MLKDCFKRLYFGFFERIFIFFYILNVDFPVLVCIRIKYAALIRLKNVLESYNAPNFFNARPVRSLF